MTHVMSKRLPHLTANDSFGPRLRQLRLERSMTQEELGKKVGLSTRMVCYYEVQRGTPSAQLMAKFAHALRVSLDEFMEHEVEEEAGDTPKTGSELRLWRRVREVQKLPPAERRAVLHLIDGLLQKKTKRG